MLASTAAQLNVSFWPKADIGGGFRLPDGQLCPMAGYQAFTRIPWPEQESSMKTLQFSEGQIAFVLKHVIRAESVNAAAIRIG